MRRYQRKRLRKTNEDNNAEIEKNETGGTGRASGAGKKAALTAGAAAGILAAAYLGGALFFQFHFLPNTTVNGRDFSARSAETLESYLREEVEGYELTVSGKTGDTDLIRGSEIALSYEGNAEAEELMEEQNAFLWPGAFFSDSVSRIETGVKYDEALLDEKIRTLKAVTGEQTEPISAAPQFDGSQFVPGQEQEGTAVDTESLTEQVRKSISELDTELELEEEGCYKEPKYTYESPEVQAACDAMNQYCRASIIYEMDQPVVVDKALISGWLTVDENMEVSLNTEAVRQWLAELGKQYDTVGKTRTFTTAAVHGPQDWGSTYVEVDLTRQHMWYVKDGSVVMEADVVTGKPTPDKETPQGVYSILEMKRNKVLLGDIKANGQREYETLVAYWMRVTWTGIGFHDATWQTAFGGERYKTAGSHGCINMSLSDAGRLYEMLEMYTPVVMHY